MAMRRRRPAKEAAGAGVAPVSVCGWGWGRDWGGKLKGRCGPVFARTFGFEAVELASWRRLTCLLFRPADPASLGVVRALFGMLMVLDVAEERGLGEADVRWASPLQCHFPLFDFLQPPALPWMCMVYLIMWAGAVGIMLGYHFRASCAMFTATFWFVLLLEKGRWNNHSYLFGIVAILLTCSSANHYFSLDALRCGWKDRPVPSWNYAVLRFQFFLLYFFAGLKKLDHDWINGYSMTHINNHWVFDPFKLVLTPEQVDFWIVHIVGFLLDLTVGFWMYLDATRPVAFLFCGMFHLMNSRLFAIGMFPYVCLATMPLFCHNDWPRVVARWAASWRARGSAEEPRSASWERPGDHAEEVRAAGCLEGSGDDKPPQQLSWRHHLTGALLLGHVGLQLFLPHSHFITKGYNTWTNGLYGYSWDMMVHSWDTILVVVKVVEQDSGREHFLDPDAWVANDRWTKHADMAKQYAGCVARNLQSLRPGAGAGARSRGGEQLRSDNISLHVDVWCSLNGRFQQRVFDPRVDLLRAPWSPFRAVPWVMPLLTELSPMRERLRRLEAEVRSWSNHSDALFVADFPGLFLENYITRHLDNVTLTVLSGRVLLELNPPLAGAGSAPHVPRRNVTLSEGERAAVPVEAFHRVHTQGDRPACYMYTYANLKHLGTPRDPLQRHPSEIGVTAAGQVAPGDGDKKAADDSRTLIGGLRYRGRIFKRSIALVSNAVLNILYSVPMVQRVRLSP